MGCNSGKGDVVGEPVDGEGISDAEGTGDIASVIAAVLGRGADISSIDAMGCHVGSLVRYGVLDDDTGDWGSKRAFVEIEIAVKVGIG